MTVNELRTTLSNYSGELDVVLIDRATGQTWDLLQEEIDIEEILLFNNNDKMELWDGANPADGAITEALILG